MRRSRVTLVTVALGVVAQVAYAEPSPQALVWSRVRAPSGGAAQAIGGYSAGCIEGAVALPTQGGGYRVARPERGRTFGHPLLISVIRDLGRRLQRLHLPLLAVGDLAQPRGGPAPTGHASHQTGLDVDLWFVPPAGKETVSMVDAAHARPSARFDAAVARQLELAASDARVDRIFVNPVLKRALCGSAVGARDWLRKLRPWWGHADHFHVRLACPADSPGCVPQPPLPPGDGCDTLAWWFSGHEESDRAREHQSYAARVSASPELPDRCRALVDGEPGAGVTAAPAPAHDPHPAADSAH